MSRISAGRRWFSASLAAAALAWAALPAMAHAKPLTEEGSGNAFKIWKKPELPPLDHWTVQRPAGAAVLEIPADLKPRGRVAPAAREPAHSDPLVGASVPPRHPGRDRDAPRIDAARPLLHEETLSPASPRAVPLYAYPHPVTAPQSGIFMDMPPRGYGVFGHGLDDDDLLIGFLGESPAGRARRIAEENLERGEVDPDRPRTPHALDGGPGVFVTPPLYGPRRAVQVCVYDHYWRSVRCLTPPDR